MIKLCVGADDIDDLVNWQRRVMRTYPAPVHHTRMFPKRADELKSGGSMYWVIRGLIQVRQRIVDVKHITDREGRKACELVFDPELITVSPRRKKAFQGWRYLALKDAPPDIGQQTRTADLSPALRAGLLEAGVW